MSKRGRKTTWWGWEFFSETPEKNASNNVMYICQVPIGKDKDDKPLLCCESLAYAGTNSSLKLHLQGRHRVWYAEKKSGFVKNPSKQARLTDIGIKVEKIEETEKRHATKDERDQLDADLLGFVVDDLRGVSYVEGSICFLPFHYIL
jgi:hypothetical protein